LSEHSAQGPDAARGFSEGATDGSGTPQPSVGAFAHVFDPSQGLEAEAVPGEGVDGQDVARQAAVA